MAVMSSNTPVEIVGAETDYTPPVFNTAHTRAEAPPTGCASCPSAIWFKKAEWCCFCNIMKFASWPGESITACDGRETSVARYVVERQRLTGGNA